MLPFLEAAALDALVADHLSHSDLPSKITLVSDPQTNIESEPELSMIQIIAEWKGLGRTPHRGLYWDESDDSAKQRNWKKMGGVALAILCLSLWLGYRQTVANIATLQKRLKQSQQQIETSKNEIQELEAYTREQNHFIELNALFEHLQALSSLAPNALGQIITPIQGIWVKTLSYEEGQLELRLLTQDPNLITQVLTHLKQTPMIESVHLTLQQTLKINKHPITEFALSIKLIKSRSPTED